MCLAAASVAPGWLVVLAGGAGVHYDGCPVNIEVSVGG